MQDPVRKIRCIASGLGASLAVAGGALLLALWWQPPPLLRIAANYAAKTVCSNVFLAGRDPEEVLRDDVQAPGIALLGLMRVSVNRGQRTVHAGLLGFIGGGAAAAREQGGCAVMPDGDLVLEPLAAGARAPQSAAAPGAGGVLWPDGDRVETDAAIDRLIADDALSGPGTRAVIVVDHGRVIGARYGAGFDAHTPQLGWSMTKTVTAGLIGVLIAQGRLALDQAGFWPAADGREKIRVADLLAMSSGLRWNEGYGTVSDVTRMLFLESDMAAFARRAPLAHPVGTYFSYSSGTAVILARIAQDAAASKSLQLPRELLFDRLGMQSAVIEADAHGTLVGSSYMYATPLDWARYGQFLLQGGVWRGEQILPPGYVAMMRTPVAASHGQYGHGQLWLWGSDARSPGVDPDAAFGIPPDVFWLEGHDNQFIAVIPSRELVIVRLGLTPARTGYRPQPLVRALLAALGQGAARPDPGAIPRCPAPSSTPRSCP